MSEEERKAIEDIEEMIELYEDDCLLTTGEDIMYLKVILNLIEKQQKEIEELRNPTICGRTIEEIINILNGLDLEKETKLEVTMENLKYFMAIYQKEVEDSIHNTTTHLIKDLSGTGARIEFQIPHYDFLKKENNK